MPLNPDVRWKQRFQNFRRALDQLRRGVYLATSRPLTELEQQGIIQAFEFTHELAWNTLKDFLEDRGATGIHGSKDATRKAFGSGLIEDGECWMNMIQSRNRTTHTYNHSVADQIAQMIITSYFLELEKFEARFMLLEMEA